MKKTVYKSENKNVWFDSIIEAVKPGGTYPTIPNPITLRRALGELIAIGVGGVLEELLGYGVSELNAQVIRDAVESTRPSTIDAGSWPNDLCN